MSHPPRLQRTPENERAKPVPRREQQRMHGSREWVRSVDAIRALERGSALELSVHKLDESRLQNALCGALRVGLRKVRRPRDRLERRDERRGAGGARPYLSQQVDIDLVAIGVRSDLGRGTAIDV